MDLETVKEEWKARKLAEYEAKLAQDAEVEGTRAMIRALQDQRRELMDEINCLREQLPETQRRKQSE